MKIIFEKDAEKDLKYWKKTNRIVAKKITSLIKNIQTAPYTGLGNPEQLKYKFSGCWSRRIDREHRIVYSVLEVEKTIIIHQCKGHYKD